MAQRKGGIGPLDPIFDVETQYGSITGAVGNTPGNAGVAVSINQAAGQADPATTSPILYDVIFSEAVTGFVSGDVVITGTAGAFVDVVINSGDDIHFTVEISGMDSCGTVVARIPAGVCTGIISGEPNRASISIDNTVTFNVTYDYVVLDIVGGALWNSSIDELDTSADYPEIIGYETSTDLGGGLIRYEWTTTGNPGGSATQRLYMVWDGLVSGSYTITDGVVVGGGGGGGKVDASGSTGGGGGAGQMIVLTSATMSAVSDTRVGVATSTNNEGGYDSQFGANVADGGGAGGGNPNFNGASGGSGGGGNSQTGTGGTGGASTGAFGNAGGDGAASAGGTTRRAGGGGGAATAGTTGVSGGTVGTGGAGREWPIGSGDYYCAGGTGGVGTGGTQPAGGSPGGGGAGGNSTSNDGDGASRPGSGGGGARTGSSGSGAAGYVSMIVSV